MAKPNKLLDIERERGDLHQVIPALVNQNNGLQTVAARILGVSAVTISLWLKKNGYRPVTRWERE